MSNLISVKVIKKPRLNNWCDDCRKVKAGPMLRLYGSAYRGDPPYALYQCPECAEPFSRTNNGKKVRDALDIIRLGGLSPLTRNER